MEKIQDLFERSSVYDSKHIANLSTRKVPAELLQAIENGCSIETLQTLAGKKFPICKYKTQITIHGIFDEPSINRVGIYKNLVQNKNKSLGVRWSAIDEQKKTNLFDLVCSVSNWYVLRDSQNYSLKKSRRFFNLCDAQTYLNEAKKEIESINISLFTGTAFCYILSGFGVFYVISQIDIKCFPVENLNAIAANITGLTDEAIKIKFQQIKDQREREKAEHEQRARIYEEQTERARAEKLQQVKDWQIKNPIPANFNIKQNYTLQPGDVFIKGIIEEDGNFKYRFYLCSKSFGRLIVTRCNEDGVKDARFKGHEPIKKTLKAVYIKRA